MSTGRLVKIASPFVLLAVIYFVGPTPDKLMLDKNLPVVPKESAALENYITQNESKHKIKPDNEARIVWLDSTKNKTEFAVVYLHGFSASYMEGEPVHRQFAKQFGCNMFLS